MDVSENLCPEISYDRETNLFEKVVVDVVKDSFQSENEYNYDGEGVEEYRILFYENLIKKVFDHVGLRPGEQGNKNHGDHGNQEFCPVWPEYLEQPEKDFFV